MNRLAALKMGFLLALLLLCAGSSWMVVRFALPRPEYVYVGAASDYTSKQAPRQFFQGGIPFYVLVADGELIALYARSPIGMQCRIRWDPERQFFFDPCYDTHMFRDGVYRGWGPPFDMKRLPLRTEEGQVWVLIGYR